MSTESTTSAAHHRKKSARALTRRANGAVRPSLALPPSLLARVDASAEHSRRTRCAEVCVLLEEALDARAKKATRGS